MNILNKVTKCIIVILTFTSIGCSNVKSKFGLYISHFPNFSMELQQNGNVFLTPKKGTRFYCVSKGSWVEMKNNQIKIDLEINDGCEWINDFSGIWVLSECNNFDGSKTFCLEKGEFKLIKN